jgi:hypothetical protein
VDIARRRTRLFFLFVLVSFFFFFFFFFFFSFSFFFFLFSFSSSFSFFRSGAAEDQSKGLTSPGHPPSPKPSKRGRSSAPRGNGINTAMRSNALLTYRLAVF